MPQATVENSQQKSSAAVGTDDLVAEMAGNEIDRLLADAELELPESVDGVDEGELIPPILSAADTRQTAPTSMAAALDASPSTGAALADVSITKELDQVFDRQLSESAGDPQPAKPAAVDNSPTPVPPSSVPEPTPLAGVSDLLGRLESGERMPPPASAAVSETLDTAKADTTPTNPLPASPAPPNSASGNSATSEIHAPGASLAVAETTTAATGGTNIVAEAAIPAAAPENKPPIDGTAAPFAMQAAPESRRWPKLTRLLDLLAFPLDPFPDGVRDVLGKVAIVTMLNAIAVMIYVLFFKK